MSVVMRLPIGVLLFISSNLFSLPTGGESTCGEVAFSLLSDTMEIHASDGAIIEWADFSIQRGETAQFFQPSAESFVLNRVTQPVTSQILGKLFANGKVVILNPLGIFIGKEARIDTGALIASTLDLHSKENNFHFKGSSKGKIWGEGQIVARGDVHLISERIDWAGSIQSGADVALLAGNEIALHLKGLSDLSLRYEEVDLDSPNISFSGSITGKQIALFGPSIELLPSASLDASDAFKGGNIWIGGFFKGHHPSIQNATALFVHEGATISANALENGDGGNVILWSDSCTIVNGMISAQGGPFGGDGGFIEISSHGTLYPNGMVFTSAPQGKSGELLIDPVNVILTNVGPNSGFVALPFNPVTLTGNAVILYNTLQGWLTTNNNVTIQTSMGVGGVGNITAQPTGAGPNASVLWNTAANLVFDVRGTLGNVLLQHSFACHGTGSLSILADGPAACHGNAIGTITIRGDLQSAAQRHTYFGSRQGATTINAPGYNVRLEVPNIATQIPMAMIGYPAGFPVAGGFNNLPCTGPISVVCSDLIMIDQNVLSTALPTATQVGHGWASNAGAGTDTPTVTTATATINVMAHGNIEMTTGSRQSYAHIGHGGGILFTTSSFNSDLTVSCGGDLIMTVPNNNVGSAAQIGHGGMSTQAPGISIDGVINLTVNGSISMTAPTNGTNNLLQIGHRGTTGAIAIGQIRSSPINVRCGGDLLMRDSATSHPRILIAHGESNISPFTLNGGIFVSVGGDLTIEGLSTNIDNSYLIGRAQPVTLTGFSPVEVAVGGTLTMNGLSPVAGLGFQIGFSGSAAGNNTSTTVIVGEDILLNSVKPSNGVASYGLGITSFGDVFVSSGGNVEVNAANRALPVGRVFIGTNDTDHLVTPRVTHVYVGGNLLATNGTNNRALLGEGPLPPVTPTYSVDLRAAGDIQLANSIVTTIGTLFISADSNILAGLLWENSAGNLISCCGFPLSTSLPYSLANFLAPCPVTAPSQGLLQNSPAIANDGLGGIRTTNLITLQTTSGNITLESAPLSTSGVTAQNLSIGAIAPNNVNLVTTSGNIEIFGSANDPTSCIRGDSFLNVTIDQAITTTGSIFISANNNISFTANGSLSTPSDVTLIVDNQMPASPLVGTGSFLMAAGSFINGNPVRIYTAQQPLNQILGQINGMAFAPGTLFTDTATEIWCTYWCNLTGGVPFTIFYKNCLGPVVEQAEIVTSQFIFDLNDENWFFHGINEYYGWPAKFTLFYDYKDPSPYADMPATPFFIRRKRDLLIVPGSDLKMSGG